MPPEDKQQNLPPDVLSNLPDNVIDDILGCLSLHDAVRTSILSKSWRYNWCRLSLLKIDQAVWEQHSASHIYPVKKITDIFNHLLSLHVGPISKCILFIPDFGLGLGLGKSPDIDKLINFLSRKDIQHLNLQLSSYRLPSSIFACLQLAHLTLEKCYINRPPVFKGFDRLITLELHLVTISFLGSLISNCPLLEHLVLEHLGSSDHVEIDAPRLRSFVFEGNIDIVHLKNVPLLAKVSLVWVCSFVRVGIHATILFQSIPALEHLHWKFSFFKNLFAESDGVPRRLSSNLNCLKRLHLNLVYVDDVFDLSCTLCLIRSSPHLQDIKLQVFHLMEGAPAGVTKDYVDEIPASFSDVTLNHLRTVTINGVVGEMPELQLINILLAKSPALVRMVINPCTVGDKKSLEVLEEITKFQRASSKAEVVYNVRIPVANKNIR